MRAVRRRTDPSIALIRALQDEHGGDLLRYAQRHARNRESAEDVVQETFSRAWRHPAAVSGTSSSARAWLFTVARNLIVDELRSAHHNREIAVDAVPEQAVGDSADALLDRILLSDALTGLSPEHRAVLVDAYWGGRSVREIAERLGVPEGTVKSRLHYGMRALRLALQERGVTR
ncbi:MAG TPA: sigma-70 family RNA polymerase sigma factor [Amnibacterium sp.]|jgi:RNA polymerase sigma-70 factor (ECF subfamily)